MQPFVDIPGLHLETFGDPNDPLYSLEGMIHLPVWAGFQSRRGSYASIDKNEPSDGTVVLRMGSDRLVDRPGVSPEQAAAYHYLIANQASIQKEILTFLLEQYADLRQAYGYEPEEALKFMPDVTDAEGFKRLIGLSTLHILEDMKEGLAYVGYGFGCKWDDEHGLGIMTHRETIIDWGGFDSSFLSWIAEKDIKSAGSD